MGLMGQGGMFACLDLGATNIRGTWVDSCAQSGLLHVLKRPGTLDGTKSVLISLVEQILSEAPCPVQAIGLASAGPLDHVRRLYLKTANMPELDHFAVGDFLSACFSLPVFLENDAQAAALGEAWAGCLQGSDNCLLLTLGTGVGSGVILQGRLFRAAHLTGPELGHLFLADKNGRYCGCGQKGCAELWLGKQGLFDLLRIREVNCSSLHKAYLLCEQNHAQARLALTDYGKWLGRFLAGLQVIFGVSSVGLSGGLSVFYPFFKAGMWETLCSCLTHRQWWLPKRIEHSSNPDLSGILGMAWICRQGRC